MGNKLFAPAPYVWRERVWNFRDSVNTLLQVQIDVEFLQKSRNYGLAMGKLIYDYFKTDGGHQSYTRSYDMNYRLPNCEACFEIHRQADLENTGPLHPSWQYNRSFMADNNTDFNIKPKVHFFKVSKITFL